MEDIWVPVTMFISIAVVLSLFFYFRYRMRSAVQQTVQVAIEKGQELSPELLDRLGQPRTSGDVDMRRGIISLGLGVAIALFGFILDEADAVRPLLGISAFPFVLGLAYLGLWRFGGDKDA